MRIENIRLTVPLKVNRNVGKSRQQLVDVLIILIGLLKLQTRVLFKIGSFQLPALRNISLAEFIQFGQNLSNIRSGEMSEGRS